MSEKYAGIFISTHNVCCAASKAHAIKNLSNWKSESLTAEDWIGKLGAGQTISPSAFAIAPGGTYTHKEEFWKSTHFICADADNIKSDKNPDGVEMWTEKSGLSKRFPDLKSRVYAVGQSVSSMSEDKPPAHRRYRLVFLFDKPIESKPHYHQILHSLANEFPIIPKDKRVPSQPVFGNSREGFGFTICGNVLPLSDFPYIEPEPEPEPEQKIDKKGRETKTLDAYLREKGVEYTPATDETGKYYVTCPFTSHHTDGKSGLTDAYVFDDGKAWAFYCSHASCANRRTWDAFKDGNGIVSKKQEDKNPARPKRENPLPKLKDGSDYFVHDDFNVLAMSDFIQTQFTIWAQDAGIFIYDKKTGVYILGELEIDKAVRKELGILRKKRYTDEVLADLRACCRKDNLPDNSHLIGFRNGVLELAFGKNEVINWKAHSPDNYLTTVFPVDYKMDAPVTKGSADFDSWLTEVLDDDTELVKVCYEAIGSIFHKGSVDMQRGLLLVGEGGTGKSMFLSQVQRLIGRENICARAWAEYGNSDFAFGDLFGKALALDSDIDVARPLSGAIKPAVTGNILTCNKKYQQPFDFNPFATWIGSINKFPKTRDKTWGFFRRWIVIPFNKTFKTDSQFEREKRKLWTDDKTVSRIILDSIFLYILAYQEGSFTVPDAAAEMQREMYQSANSVISWLDGETETEADAQPLTRAEAYQAYAEYCQQHTFDAENNRSFLSTLRSQGYSCDKKVSVNGAQERVIEGLLLL